MHTIDPHIVQAHRYALPTRTRAVSYLTMVAAVATLSACRGDAALPTAGAVSVARYVHEEVAICHFTESGSVLKTIPASALAGHRSHGDYVTGMQVDAQSGGATDPVHFNRITDAIAAARQIRADRNELETGSCRITISVASGLRLGSFQASSDATFERFPLTIDAPDITLHGMLAMPVDQVGRASGIVSSASTALMSIIEASPGLQSIKTGNVLDKYAEPMIVVNSHPGGSQGDGVVIEGFVFRSGNGAPGAIVGGNAVWAMRAHNLMIRGNQIEAGFAEPVELRVSTARVEQNFLTGAGGSCALCMFGPGDYNVVANKQVGFAGRLAVLVFPAILAAVPPGVEQNTLAASALVTVAVTNNQFRDHQEVPFGIGVRVAALGPGAPSVVGTARVVVQDNDLSHNRFGIVAEAGFPVANTTLQSHIDLTLHGNDLSASCQVGLLVALTNQGTAIGSGNAPSLRNSNYTINLGGDLSWENVWYKHPANVGNTLTVDGQVIPNGSVVPYDGTRSCPVQ